MPISFPFLTLKIIEFMMHIILNPLTIRYALTSFYVKEETYFGAAELARVAAMLLRQYP